MNESTWEHLKLAFWPALLLSPFHRWLYGPMPGWLFGTAVRTLVPSVGIIAIFYGYTALIGAHYLAADLATFIIAVFAGETLGHAVMPRPTRRWLRVGAAVYLALAVIAFGTFSFAPPDWFLFADPAAVPNRSAR